MRASGTASKRSPSTKRILSPTWLRSALPLGQRQRCWSKHRWREFPRSGSSLANATAIAPLPVPRSRIRSSAPEPRRRASSSAISTSSSVSGRGINTSGVYVKIERPEFPRAGDIRRRLALETAQQQPFINSRLPRRRPARRRKRSPARGSTPSTWPSKTSASRAPLSMPAALKRCAAWRRSTPPRRAASFAAAV